MGPTQDRLTTFVQGAFVADDRYYYLGCLRVRGYLQSSLRCVPVGNGRALGHGYDLIIRRDLLLGADGKISFGRDCPATDLLAVSLCADALDHKNDVLTLLVYREFARRVLIPLDKETAHQLTQSFILNTIKEITSAPA